MVSPAPSLGASLSCRLPSRGPLDTQWTLLELSQKSEAAGIMKAANPLRTKRSRDFVSIILNSTSTWHGSRKLFKLHEDIAAQTEYCGEIWQEAGTCLGVYLIEKLSGITYIEMGNSSIKMNPEQASKRLRIIEDFAGYVDVKNFFYVDYYKPMQLIFLPYPGFTRNWLRQTSKRTSESAYLTSSLFSSPRCLLVLLPSSFVH